MTFQKAEDFLMIATQKFNLHRQAKASLVCERVRKIFNAKYENLADQWQPMKFEDGVLFIQTESSSASSDLFLRTHEMIELFSEHEFPQKIEDIRIVRKG